MTDLRKPIHRRTIGTRREQSRSRPLIISLEPGDVVAVRIAGTRQSYRVSIEGVYEYAMRQHLARVDKRARQLVKSEGLKMRSAMVRARKELAGDLKP
jgi:phosphoglucomutase